MIIKAIIWDLEGVILRTADGSVPATLARLLDVPVEIVKPVLDSNFDALVDLGEFTQDEYWDYIIAKVGRPPEYRRRLDRFFDDEMKVDQQVLEDIHNYHKYLKNCLLSNFSKDLRGLLKKYWPISNAFDEILISSEIRKMKPQPEAFQLALDALGCKAEETILVDDRQVNIEGANAYGLHGILFRNRQDMNKRISEIMNNHHGAGS